MKLQFLILPLFLLLLLEGCEKLNKDYEIRKAVDYLKSTKSSTYIMKYSESGETSKFVGASFQNCMSVGEKGIDPTIANSYVAIMIYSQGIEGYDGISVKLTYDNVGTQKGESEGRYSIKSLEWAKAANSAVLKWYKTNENNNFCFFNNINNSTNIDTLSTLKQTYKEIILNGFMTVNTMEKNKENRMILFFKLYDIQNNSLNLCTTMRGNNSIESILLDDKMNLNTDTVKLQLKEHCNLW